MVPLPEPIEEDPRGKDLEEAFGNPRHPSYQIICQKVIGLRRTIKTPVSGILGDNYNGIEKMRQQN